MKEKILEVLKEITEDGDFEHSQDFLEDGLLDSYDMVNLVTELEDAFDVEVSGRDIVPENFVSLDAIAALLNRYMEG